MKERERRRDSQEVAKRGERNISIQSQPWCSKKSIWQIAKTSRWEINKKRCDSIGYARLQDFLFHENEIGNISRQELVSQIPVMLLDVQPHHQVLDMCASPGSKTRQVLSCLHAAQTPQRTTNTSEVIDEMMPAGFVIANEFDTTRCDDLAHRLKCDSSPCLITVNHDGQGFPEFYRTGNDTTLLCRERGVGIFNSWQLLCYTTMFYHVLFR